MELLTTVNRKTIVFLNTILCILIDSYYMKKLPVDNCCVIRADLMTVNLKVIRDIIPCSLCVILNCIISQNTQNK